MTRSILFAVLLFTAAPGLMAQEAATDTGRVYAIGDVTERPRATNARELLDTLRASYPGGADGRSAEVEVAIVIDTDGNVRDARVVHSTDAVFNSATVSAVRVLRFAPASLDGRPVAVAVNLPIRWEPARVASAQPDSQDVYDARSVDEPPMARNVEVVAERMEQLYPPDLRITGQGGEVVLRLLVDEQGAVKDVEVESSTNPALDPPSLAVGRELAFPPARMGGQPVSVWTSMPLLWESEADVVLVEEAETDSTYELSAVTRVPQIRNESTLRRELQRQYPSHLKPLRQNGRVQARFRVGADGTVSRISIVQSTHEDFNRPTIVALRTVRFLPALLNGRPVATWVELPIQWNVVDLFGDPTS